MGQKAALYLLSSFLALLSNSSSYCPVPLATVQFPRSTVKSLFLFLGFLKAGYILDFIFHQTIHPSIKEYLFFQIRKCFPIYWVHTHHAIFEFLALLSSSSRYCPVPHAIVQFLALLSSSSRYCPVPPATEQFLALLCSFLTLLSSMLPLDNSARKLDSCLRNCDSSSRKLDSSARNILSSENRGEGVFLTAFMGG